MPPLTLMIKPVSGNCNMHCSYCFYADEISNRTLDCSNPMSQEILERVVRSAFIYADHTLTFVFQGGEPTLAGASFFQNFLKLERKFNHRDLSVHHAIQTNGLFLSDELLDVFIEGDFLVGVSLDGIMDIHDARRLDHSHQGTYERALQTVNRLKQNKIPYNILCVVDNEIAKQPEACYKELKRHGYVQFIACLEPFGQHNTVLDPCLYGEFLIKTYRRYAHDFRNNHYVSVSPFEDWLNVICGYEPSQCGMTGHCAVNFLVESNGDVFPCDFYALDQWKLGNVQDTNLLKMDISDLAREFISISMEQPAKCKVCQWFPICRNGCRRDRKTLISGEERGVNRLCEGFDMFFSECLADMRQLALLAPPTTIKSSLQN